jgi:hypothetical protein
MTHARRNTTGTQSSNCSMSLAHVLDKSPTELNQYFIFTLFLLFSKVNEAVPLHFVSNIASVFI